MTLIYRKVARKSQINEEKEVRYYPTLRRISRVDEKDIARRLAQNTTLNYNEAMMAINQLRDEIIDCLLDGKTVSLGDWATIFLTATADGAPTEEECNANYIRSLRAHCRFTPDFRWRLNSKAQFIHSGRLLSKSQLAAAQAAGIELVETLSDPDETE